MKKFERLSYKVLIRTCPCGIVFKTYDLKKVYHSNNCRERRELKQKLKRKLENSPNMEKTIDVDCIK